jgi:peptidyl-tRNA hydrolase
LSPGYQTVQSAHAVAEFAHTRPLEFKKWREEGNYLICLAVKDLIALNEFMETLQTKGIDYITFYEPDIEEITAIVLSPSTEADKAVGAIPLACRKSGEIDKHTFKE